MVAHSICERTAAAVQGRRAMSFEELEQLRPPYCEEMLIDEVLSDVSKRRVVEFNVQ